MGSLIRFVFLLTCLVCARPMMAQDDWQLVWSDEFDGTGELDSIVWDNERGFVRNHEDQWYQASNARRENGMLVIEARREHKDNPLFVADRVRGPRRFRDWRRSRRYIEITSSSVTTRKSFSFLFGRLEVRAKIPTAGGSWPAIWLLGKDAPWPSCGEIDVMEYYRIKDVPHILANACWGSDNHNAPVWNSKRIPFTHFTDKDNGWADKFHVWRMDWNPVSIDIYLDDELLNSIPMHTAINGKLGNYENPFTKPMYILLNLAIGGDNGGDIDFAAFPMRYEIDYVRVYQPKMQAGMRVRTLDRDSIRLSDPCILADSATNMYYMTGTSGLMFTSYDLNKWTGPFRVAKTNPQSWMGDRPEIWAAELHQYKGKYYYFATFTNNAIKIDTVHGNVIPRRASHVLVSDRAFGPYVPMQDEVYLNPSQPTLDGTFWQDTDGNPYMVFCGEWLQNWNGTVERQQLKPDLSGPVGLPQVLFRASDSPWSREKIPLDERTGTDSVQWNKVTDGPWLFRTGTGRLGMLWTSWVYNVYTQGVAYSASGTLAGPWVQEPEPITPPNFGHSMLFRAFDGQWLMSVHSHKEIGGRYHRVPHLFEVDLSGDKLVLGRMIEGRYVPKHTVK